MNDHNYNQYSANDLALVSVLIHLGFVVERIEKDANGKATFYFDRGDRLEETLSKYWSGQIRVEPRAYFDAIKRAKTRIYAEA